LIKALDLSGVADGTDLHGLQHWACYRDPLHNVVNTGAYVIQGGEIVASATVAEMTAYWLDPDVAVTGHCVRAEVRSANWATGVDMPGLVANAVSDRSEDTRCLFSNSYDLRHRTNPADYGSGAPVASGATPGQPFSDGAYYPALFASVQNPTVPGNHARGGFSMNQVEGFFNDTTAGLGTGITDGTSTYPGLVYRQNIGMRWRNYKVYYDYRILVKGLSSSEAFRVFDTSGTPIFSSGAQSGGEAHVNVHTTAWPIAGYIQIYSDTTWAAPLSNGRYPSAGNAPDISGGDIYDQVTASSPDRIGVLVNWEADDDWLSHSGDDVTVDHVESHITQVAANPRIEVDTWILTLRDPTGRYVPADTNSPLYSNVKLEREARWNIDRGGTKVCRFHGKIREFAPSFPHKTDADRRQHCVIRVESPLRDLVDAKVTLVTVPSGILVKPDGTGVIADLLALIPDIIPAVTWQLEPNDVSITDAFLSSGMGLQSALEQCAIIGDAVYYIKPHFRVSSTEPKFYFVWRPRTTDRATVDHSWVDVNDDISFLTPRFTSDDL